MSKKVLLLHGWGGSDYPHWQAQTAMQLIQNNYQVSFPILPNKDTPNLQSWLEFLDKEIQHFNPDIIVCHSLANILWFHYVSKYDTKVLDKLMLVSPVKQNCTTKELETFFPYPIPKDLKAKEIIMVGSTNDKYMSADEIMDLQSDLNIGLKILEDAGHINADSGYGELSCAYDWIERINN